MSLLGVHESRGKKMTELEQLKEDFNAMALRIKELEDKEAKKQSVERWRPKHQESYFYIDSTHEIIQEINEEDEVFDLHYESFNVFKTRAEAEKERNIQQVWKELRQFAKEWNACAGTHLYFIRYGISFKNSTLIDQELKDKFGDRLKLLDEI